LFFNDLRTVEGGRTLCLQLDLIEARSLAVVEYIGDLTLQSLRK